MENKKFLKYQSKELTQVLLDAETIFLATATGVMKQGNNKIPVYSCQKSDFRRPVFFNK